MATVRRSRRSSTGNHGTGNGSSKPPVGDGSALLEPAIKKNAAPRPAVETAVKQNRESDGKLDQKQLLEALLAFKNGDFTVRLPVDCAGLDGKIADAFNDVIELNRKMACEWERLSRVVGKEGRIAQRASLGTVSGSWAESVDSVNALIDDLVHPTSETARVIGAVAKGDLSQTMAMEIEGRPLQGRISAHRQNRQHDGRSAQLVRLAK